ncbi:26S protease regulatory subunit 6B-like protein [Hordeum vulgare]|nr:26S protease regulatory subunit 6B-like protein [Hordeum vulgare]
MVPAAAACAAVSRIFGGSWCCDVLTGGGGVGDGVGADAGGMSASLGSRRRGRLRDGSCSGGFGPRRRRRRSRLVSVEEEEEDDADADACCLKNPYWDPSSPAANSTADPTLPAHAVMYITSAAFMLTVQDIGGCDIQKQEIREAVELPLTHHELYKQIGIDPPRGVLLYGPAGTGKTMLAKAVAHHTTAAFIRVVGSEFVQKYLGEVSCGLCLQCIVIYPAGFSFQKRPAAAATSTMDGA